MPSEPQPVIFKKIFVVIYNGIFSLTFWEILNKLLLQRSVWNFRNLPLWSVKLTKAPLNETNQRACQQLILFWEEIRWVDGNSKAVVHLLGVNFEKMTLCCVCLTNGHTVFLYFCSIFIETVVLLYPQLFNAFSCVLLSVWIVFTSNQDVPFYKWTPNRWGFSAIPQ